MKKDVIIALDFPNGKETLEFLDKYDGKKPFFLTVSHIEPHHQNDREDYEGPDGSKERFKDCKLPKDLEILGGDAKQMYPDYLGCCKSLDDNLFIRPWFSF